MPLLLPFDDAPSAPAVRVLRFAFARRQTEVSDYHDHGFGATSSFSPMLPRHPHGLEWEPLVATPHTSHTSVFVLCGNGFGFLENKSVLAGVGTSPATR